MSDNANAASQCIARCMLLRHEGRLEAVLRSEFASWLRSIFPSSEDGMWVGHYSEGAEAGTQIGHSDGTISQRFVDNLVRSTVIEYESDLRQQSRFDEGYSQVREYVAGAVRSGVPISQVRGILSDTVDWHVYDAVIPQNVIPAECTPDDVTLVATESLILTDANHSTSQRFVEFLRKHLARQQSRTLNADLIATDLGLESLACRSHADQLAQLVTSARDAEVSVKLSSDLWSKFVDYLEGTAVGFRVDAFVDEAYIAILARLLCANILQQRAVLSDDDELKAILTGRYFEEFFHLHNMVEQDYFGWLWREPHLDRILPIAREVQRDLYAYDFRRVGEQDLFGRLMSQLGRRTQRKLLGQEWTPQWVAHQLSQRCIEQLNADEPIRVLDMCCGSGTILAEVLKYICDARPHISFEELTESVTGFDIDPLAVLLAKTTWVVTLADKIRASSDDVVIPVFHADSLFAVTPLTKQVPLPGQSHRIIVNLDGEQVHLPSNLIAPEMRQLFDGIIDWAYDEAREARSRKSNAAITAERVRELVVNLAERYSLHISGEVLDEIATGAFALAKRMADLAIADRNGIWAFILRNTYRPGLLAGRFNGLVCNPPWLALSQLADNPYKDQLTARAELYDIKPGGAAHLHLELATTHLLHAIDRYLMAGAKIACLLPGTVLNGQHHAKFRDRAYLRADREVPFELTEIWEIAPGTFKVRAIAAFGVKRPSVEDVLDPDLLGAFASQKGIEAVPVVPHQLGERTAWSLGDGESTVREESYEIPPQGADLMPRPAVCIEIVNRTGTEWRVRTPRRSDPGYFSIKDAKKLKGQNFDGSVAPEFVYRMVQSLNLLPFLFDSNYVHIAIPARRGDDGQWEVMDVASIRTAGFTQSARRFGRINEAMERDGVVKELHEKIDERNKLSQQILPKRGYLVLNGAGGGVACAACLQASQVPDIVIDQTLYWMPISTAEEAWYCVGVLNSDALSNAVRDFNPEGELGPRHLHTLPNRVIPGFNGDNSAHQRISALAKELSEIASPIVTYDADVSNATKPIAARRKRLRTALKKTSQFSELEALCATVLAAET